LKHGTLHLQSVVALSPAPQAQSSTVPAFLQTDSNAHHQLLLLHVHDSSIEREAPSKEKESHKHSMHQYDRFMRRMHTAHQQPHCASCISSPAHLALRIVMMVVTSINRCPSQLVVSSKYLRASSSAIYHSSLPFEMAQTYNSGHTDKGVAA